MTLVKKTGIVRSITAIHHEENGAPRYLIQVILYAVALTVTTSKVWRRRTEQLLGWS